MPDPLSAFERAFNENLVPAPQGPLSDEGAVRVGDIDLSPVQPTVEQVQVMDRLEAFANQRSTSAFQRTMGRFGVTEMDLPEDIRETIRETDFTRRMEGVDTTQLTTSVFPTVQDRGTTAHSSLMTAQRGPARSTDPKQMRVNLEQYKQDIGPALEAGIKMSWAIARKAGVTDPAKVEEIQDAVLADLGIRDSRQHLSEEIARINAGQNRGIFMSAAAAATKGVLGMAAAAKRVTGDDEGLARTQQAIQKVEDVYSSQYDQNQVAALIGGQIPYLAGGLGLGGITRAGFNAIATKFPVLGRTLGAMTTAAPGAAGATEQTAALRLGAGDNPNQVAEHQMQDFLATMALTGLFGAAGFGGVDAVMAGQGGRTSAALATLATGGGEFVEELTDESLQDFVNNVRGGMDLEAAATAMADTMPERAKMTFLATLPFMIGTAPSQYMQNRNAQLARVTAASEAAPAPSPTNTAPHLFGGTIDQVLQRVEESTPAPATPVQEAETVVAPPQDAEAEAFSVELDAVDADKERFTPEQDTLLAQQEEHVAQVEADAKRDKILNAISKIDERAAVLTKTLDPDTEFVSSRNRTAAERELDILRVRRAELVKEAGGKDTTLEATEKLAEQRLKRLGGEEDIKVVAPPKEDSDAQQRLERLEVKKLGEEQRKREAHAAGTRQLVEEREGRRMRARELKDIMAAADLVAEAQASRDHDLINETRTILEDAFTPDQRQAIGDIVRARQQRAPIPERGVREGLARERAVEAARVEEAAQKFEQKEERSTKRQEAARVKAQKAAQAELNKTAETEVDQFAAELDDIITPSQEAQRIAQEQRESGVRQAEQDVESARALGLSPLKPGRELEAERESKEAADALELDAGEHTKVNDDEALLREMRAEVAAEAEAKLDQALDREAEETGVSRAAAEEELARESDGIMEKRARAREAFMEVVEQPRELLKAAAKTVAWPRTVAGQGKLGGEYDGFKALPDNVKRSIRNTTGGMKPDQVAVDLYEQGVLESPDVNAMWEAIGNAHSTIVGATAEHREAQARIPQEHHEAKRTPGILDKENRRPVDDQNYAPSEHGPEVKSNMAEAREARILAGEPSHPVRAWARMIQGWRTADGRQHKLMETHAAVINDIANMRKVKAVPAAVRNTMNGGGVDGLYSTNDETNANNEWAARSKMDHVLGAFGGLFAMHGPQNKSQQQLEDDYDKIMDPSGGSRGVQDVRNLANVLTANFGLFHTITERIEAASPEIGKRFRIVNNQVREYRGKLNRTLIKYQRLTSGFAGRGTETRILEVQDMHKPWNPGNSGIYAESKLQAYVEGRLGAGELTELQRKIGDTYKELIVLTGKQFEDAGALIEINGEKVPFQHKRDGARFLRQLHGDAAQAIAQGNRKWYKAIEEALTVANPNHHVEVRDVMKAIETSSVTRVAPMEAVRKLPVVPAYVRIDGQLLQLLATSPFEAGTRLANMSTLRAAFIKEFGQFDDVTNYMEEGWVRELVDATGSNTLARHAIRAAHGLPIYERDTKGAFDVGSAGWVAVQAYDTATNLQTAANLTGSVIPNVPEPLGSGWLAGVRANTKVLQDLAVGWTDTEGILGPKGEHYGRQELGSLLADMGAITLNLTDLTVAEAGTVRRLRREVQREANVMLTSTGVKDINELMEMTASMAMVHMVEQIKTGRANKRMTRARLRMIGFDLETATRLAENKGTDEEYRDMISRAPVMLQGANALPLESAAIVQSDIYNRLFKFTGFATRKQVMTFRAVSLAVKGVFTAHTAQGWADMAVAGEYFFGNVAAGLATQAAKTLVSKGRLGGLMLAHLLGTSDDTDGIDEDLLWKHRQDFLVDATTYAMYGAPLQAIAMSISSGDMNAALDPLGPFAGVLYPYRQSRDAWAFIKGTGPYRGQNIFEQIITFVHYQAPISSIAGVTVLDLIGIGNSPRHAQARKIFFQWQREYASGLAKEGRQAFMKTATYDVREWTRIGREMQQALLNGADYAELDRIMVSRMLAKMTEYELSTDKAAWSDKEKRKKAKNALRASLRSMLTVKKLDTDGKASFRAKAGPSVYSAMEDLDSLIETAIGRVSNL
jgi:hypothetical protein